MKKGLVFFTVLCMLAVLFSGCGNAAPAESEQPDTIQTEQDSTEPESAQAEETASEPETPPVTEPGEETAPAEDDPASADTAPGGTAMQQYVDCLNSKLTELSFPDEETYTFVWQSADCRASLSRGSDSAVLGTLMFGGENGIPITVDALDAKINLTNLEVSSEYQAVAETLLPVMMQINYPRMSQAEAEQAAQDLIDSKIATGAFTGYIYASDTSISYLLNCDTKNMTFDSSEDSPAQAPDAAQTSEDSGGTVCRIDALPGEITAPAGFCAYSKGGDYTPEMCQAQGIVYDNVETYLNLSQLDVMLIPEGKTLSDPGVVIKVRVKTDDCSPEMDTAKLDDANLNALASGLVTGFGVKDYEIVRHGNLTYIKFSDHLVQDEIRYAAVINGYMVYVFAQFDGELPEEYAQALEQFALSLKY